MSESVFEEYRRSLRPNDDETLEHYGVKGMHWGVSKAESHVNVPTGDGAGAGGGGGVVDPDELEEMEEKAKELIDEGIDKAKDFADDILKNTKTLGSELSEVGKAWYRNLTGNHDGQKIDLSKLEDVEFKPLQPNQPKPKPWYQKIHFPKLYERGKGHLSSADPVTNKSKGIAKSGNSHTKSTSLGSTFKDTNERTVKHPRVHD